MTHKLFVVAVFCVFAVSFVPGSVVAQINPQINYQGKLTTPSGVAVPDGTYNMRFWLIDSPSAATSTAEWAETLTGSNRVQVTNGLFSVMLGSSTSLTSVDFNQVLYLGVEIGGTSTPAWDGEMSPRKIIGTVPAAFVAQTALTASTSNNALLVGGVASSSFLRSDEADTMAATSSDTLLTLVQNGAGKVASFFSGLTEVLTILNNGNVGVGTTSPLATLSVQGTTLFTATSTFVGGAYVAPFLGGTWLNLPTTGPSAIGTGGPGTNPFVAYVSSNNQYFTGSTIGDAAYRNASGRRIHIGIDNGVGNASPLMTFQASNIGIGDITPDFNLETVGTFAISSAAGNDGDRLIVNSSGNVGIGTTTPGSLLTVAGNTFIGGNLTTLGNTALTNASTTNLSLSGNFFDSANSGGALGAILQSTGTSTRWVATSTLGLASTFLALTDTPSSYTANRLLFTNSGASAVTDSADLVFTGTNFGIGSTTPSARLTIQGAAGTANTLTIASSTGSTTLALLASGDLEVSGQVISTGVTWTPRLAVDNAAGAGWTSITYGNGRFVAVGESGTDRVMYSDDGISWSTSTAAELSGWKSVTYGNGLFVAVVNSGTNRVMTSPDGVTWTARSAAEANGWQSVTYGNGLFVAVSSSGTNRVMTSRDGVTWTARSAAEANSWTSITYGNGRFVAVSRDGTNRVMTSPDGITWTARSAAVNVRWQTITYGNGLFVAFPYGDDSVAATTTLMTSPDGISWTTRTTPQALYWNNVSYGNGLYVALATNRLMTSLDGVTWTPRFIAEPGNIWQASVYGNGTFVAVSYGGTNRIMTSGKTEFNQIATNNVFFGGTSFMGGLRAGTTTASVASIFLQSQAGINPFAIASSSGTSLMTLTQAGNLGLGTTTPTDLLTVAGNTYIGGNLTVAGNTALTNASTTNLSLSGNFFDSANSGGALGTILQSTGTSTRWVATSTLGLASTFLALTDTPSSYTANRLLFTNSGASAVTDSADLVFTGTNFGIGSTTPSARLTIQGAAGTANTLTIASSTGSTTLAMLASGDLELPGQLISAGINWTSRTVASTSAWNAITYGNGKFVAVANNSVMHSSDGVNWSTSTAAQANSWTSVTYGNGLFVAVGFTGTNRVMTSPDGITWTARSAAAANLWNSVTYGNGLFVAVASTGANRVMTSPDGITWTGYSTPIDHSWNEVEYGNGLFVAICSSDSSFAECDDVIISPDGINWTLQATGALGTWTGLTYGNGMFVATAVTGTNRIMTSQDGVTWAAYNVGVSNQLFNITYGNGLFVTVGNNGVVLTSPDGITWTPRRATSAFNWSAITYGNGLFVAVNTSDTTAAVMTSGKSEFNQVATDNVFFGGSSFMGGLRAGTTTASVASIFLQSQAGINPFAVASSSGTSLLTLTQAGNLGLGTTTPTDLLTVAGNTYIGGNLTATGVSTLTNASTTNLSLSGNFFDSASSGGTLGMILQSTGTSTRWLATSTLAIALSDTTGTLAATRGGTGLSTITQNQLLMGGAGNTWTQVATSSLGLSAAFTNSAQLAALLSDETGTGNVVFSAAPTFTGTSSFANADLSGNLIVSGVSALTNASTTNLSLSGNFFDSANSGGALGMVMQSTGTSTRWVATSTLGLASTFLALTDTPSSYTANRLLFTNSGASAVTDSADLVFTGTNFGIGSTTPSSRLTIQGAAGTANTFTIASSTGSTTLAMLASGDLELPGQLISEGINWTARTAPEPNQWRSVTYGNGLFVAVSFGGTNRVMTSPDGVTWTARSAAAASSWASVTYGNGLFVAVAFGGSNRVMTSVDGITWTARNATEANSWTSVTYANGLFVAVSYDGTNRVMTSPDGVTWTARSAAAASSWASVTYGNGLFVAVAFGGSNRVMTSVDGITWLPQTAAEANQWYGVTYGNGLFVAVSLDGTNRVMTSPDGVTWTARPVLASTWYGVTYGNGLFVAVSTSGTSSAMTSPDGVSWTVRRGVIDGLLSVTYGNGLFVAVANNASTTAVVTSGKTEFNQIATNNIFQGGTSFMGGLRAGTTTASVASVFLQSQAGINPFAVASSSGASLLTLTQAGNLGLGTTTPGSLLTVAGNTFIGGNLTTLGNTSLTNASTTNLSLSGNFFDSANSGGTLGMVMQSTGTSTRWVATSTLGLASTFLALTDTPSSYTANRLLFTNSGASAVTDSADLVFTGTNFGIGSTTPSSRLTIQGAAGTANTLTIASSTGSTTLAMLANGNLELPGQLISAGIDWTSRSVASTSGWTSVTYGNGKFVAVGTNSVMHSSDGVNWATSTAAQANSWISVTYGNGLFVAVAFTGTNRVMTSPDGVTWTARSATQANLWTSVTYGNGLFVAVSLDGSNRVMTSSDGINWVARNAAAANGWYSVTYGNGLFVAVAQDGANRVMISRDGINWFGQTVSEANSWVSVTYGNGIFVAVANVGLTRVMTSSDGVTWQLRTSPLAASSLSSVTYGNGLFVAVGVSGLTPRLATSPDGITWTLRRDPEANAWQSVTYGNGLFVAVSNSGTNRIMTSGKTEFNQVATDNVFFGGNTFMGGLRAGTTTASVADVFFQGRAGINPFAIASSSGTSLMTLTQAGNLGLGTTTPISFLSMERTGISGTSTAGISQFLTFSNNVASAVQYGNFARLQTTNTATTTLVGTALNIVDSTTYGNTVRGIEVQTDLGSNTLGENTALSGFARTFGVRGITSGDAGATFEPAGVYGETSGTTQGNAIRGYSSTITTAALLKLFQASSAFTGTGLLMNFGNSGGSFSSTTASKFIDLQNAGTSRFTVGSYGMLTIGDGTTSQNAGIQIGNGGLCVDNDGSCNASTTGRITSVTTAAGNSDLAEMYFSNEDLVPGEVVYLKGGLSIGRASRETADLVFGVVSTAPGLLLGYNDASLVPGEVGSPIALSGRVPVRLSNENGPITVGDELMLSSVPGVVMKASSTGTVVGIALEDFDETRAYSDTFVNQFGENIIVPNFTPINRVTDPRINDGCYFGGGTATGEAPCVPLKATSTEAQFDEADALVLAEAKAEALAELAATPSETVVTEDGTAVQVGQIVMFVDLKHRYLDEDSQSLIAGLLAVASSTDDENTETIWSRLVTLANNFIDGVLSVFTLKAERVETNQLCVDDVCVTAEDLRTLLESSSSEDQIIEVIVVPPEEEGGEDGGGEGGGVETDEALPIEPEGDGTEEAPPVNPEAPLVTDESSEESSEAEELPTEEVANQSEESVEEAVTEPEAPETEEQPQT